MLGWTDRIGFSCSGGLGRSVYACQRNRAPPAGGGARWAENGWRSTARPANSRFRSESVYWGISDVVDLAFSSHRFSPGRWWG